MKKTAFIFFCVLSITNWACGVQSQLPTVSTESYNDTFPAKVVASVEPTESGVLRGIVNAEIAVNVRDCDAGEMPSIDCTQVGVLENGQEVVIVDTVRGRGCRNWHVILWFGAERFVCAEYIDVVK